MWIKFFHIFSLILVNNWSFDSGYGAVLNKKVLKQLSEQIDDRAIFFLLLGKMMINSIK